MSKFLFALGLLGAGFLACWNQQASGQESDTADSHLGWHVGYEKNKLDPQLQAVATHTIDEGGEIEITGTCDSDDGGSEITLDFDYFAKEDSNSWYDTEGVGGFAHVAIPYRIDGGKIQQANSQTKYRNSARVIFAYIAPNAKGDAGGALALGLATMFGSVQKLNEFLHAHQVEFQLPLGGGGSEIVKIDPQDSGFQSFVSQCKIDLRRIDGGQATTQQAPSDSAAEYRQSQAQSGGDTPAPQPLSSFEVGRADWHRYYDWTAKLSGDELAGVQFWAGIRYKKPAQGCAAAPGSPSMAFQQGCEAAKKFLADVDQERMSNTDYRAGWNQGAKETGSN